MNEQDNMISMEQVAGYFWRVMELNVVPIITWESDGEITNANLIFLEMIGYTQQEFEEGKVNWRTITPPAFSYLDDKCMQELKNNPIAEPYEKKYIRKNGTLINVRLYTAALQAGETKGISMILPLEEVE